MNIDIFQELSQHLPVKDFLNLTQCNKKLRNLFKNRLLWKHFLERDFNYEWHPQYNFERYKLCYYRKYGEFEGKEIKLFNKVVPISNLIKDVINLEDWGLCHVNEEGIPLCLSMFNLSLISLYQLVINGGLNNNLLVYMTENVMIKEYQVDDETIRKFWGKWAHFSEGIRKINLVMPQNLSGGLEQSKIDKIRNFWLDVGFKKCW